MVANPMKTIKDSGKGTHRGLHGRRAQEPTYLDVLGILYSLMRELRGKPRNEVEAHLDDPAASPIFQNFPTVAAKPELSTFICDYCRLIIIGNARTHEIEALMDEEIQTVKADKLKSYHSMVTISEALPALGIVAAVLGVIKAMGALDQAPEVLGGLIGAALVGTFAGIFISYSVISPIATKMKIVREKQMRLYIIVKQTLLGFHERGDAAGGAGARPQDHLRLRAPDHRRGRAGDAERRRRRSESRTQGSGLTDVGSHPISSLCSAALRFGRSLPDVSRRLRAGGPVCAQECAHSRQPAAVDRRWSGNRNRRRKSSPNTRGPSLRVSSTLAGWNTRLLVSARRTAVF